MKAVDRREAILKYLKQQTTPTSATALAKQFSVSRQIIVGDIALLRAGGEEISATPRGYVLTVENPGIVRRVACNHVGREAMIQELYICVDQGCVVQDVVVDHPVYGQLEGQLQLHSRYDVEQFARRVEEERAHSLSELTDGIHVHTLLCPSLAAYERVCQALDKAGILLNDN